jgi:hypothetical protein
MLQSCLQDLRKKAKEVFSRVIAVAQHQLLLLLLVMVI